MWTALALAFSPVLLDLRDHLGTHPWTRYAAVFPLLFARCAIREARTERNAIGSLGIAVALLLELVAVFTGAIRWARPAPVLAAIGMTVREGLGSWRSRALLLLAVPLPAFAVKLTERAPASAMGEGAIAAFAPGATLLGSDIVVDGGTLLVMNRAWSSLAVLLAGLAWYHGTLLQRALPPTLVACALAATFAYPIQAVGLGAAVGLASSGARELAQFVVDDGVWLVATLAGVAWTEWQLRHTAAEAPA